MTRGQLQPRKTPKQPRAWETQDRILEAAARVFAEHGYPSGTTNRIAAAASMSVGSLYQYFPNKDAILVALVRRHIDDGARRIDKALKAAQADVPLADRVGLLVDAVIASHKDDRRLHQVLFEEAPRPPELLAELHQLEQNIVDSVAGLLATDPAVRKPDNQMVAWMATAAVESLTHRYVSTYPQSGGLSDFRDELVSLVISYLTAPGRDDVNRD